MLDIGAKASGFKMHLTTGGMVTQQAALLLGRFGQQVHRTVQSNGQKIVVCRQAGKAALIFQVRAITSKSGLNHIACFRMGGNITRQRQQCQRGIQLDTAGRFAFGE